MTETGVDALDRLADSLPKSSERDREAKLDCSELPGGVKVDDLSAAELGRALKELGIPGTSPNNTKGANVAAYRDHLQKVHDEAGELAVLLWHLEHEQEQGFSKDRESEKDDEE